MSSEPESTTLLEISAFGVPPYSARGLTQTLQPIQASQSQRRTVNGTLIDLSASQFRKYASSISCTDQQAPALEGVWPGMEITIKCVAELSYLTSSEAPERDVVPGSSREEGDFTFYRPILVMRVVNFNIQKDEYGAAVAWTLDCEEL